jgi:predicted MFS family arabinose efflux permease
MAVTFTEIYHFSSSAAGLCFLSNGVGNLLCTFVYGTFGDKFNNYLIKRNDGVRVPEFRLMPNYMALPFIVIGFLLYGWLLYARVHYIGPLIGVVICKF